MALILASRVNDLKARVKAECQRRAHSGSVSSYGDSSYDFSTVPATGVKALREHKDKNAIPLNAINSDIITSSMINETVILEDTMTSMESFVTVLEQRDKTDHSGTDCSGGCTGMCYGCTGTCYDVCTSCTSCSGTCKGSCTGCSNTCKGGCTGTCTGTCKGSCKITCADTCKQGIGPY